MLSSSSLDLDDLIQTSTFLSLSKKTNSHIQLIPSLLSSILEALPFREEFIHIEIHHNFDCSCKTVTMLSGQQPRNHGTYCEI